MTDKSRAHALFEFGRCATQDTDRQSIPLCDKDLASSIIRDLESKLADARMECEQQCADCQRCRDLEAQLAAKDRRIEELEVK